MNLGLSPRVLLLSTVISFPLSSENRDAFHNPTELEDAFVSLTFAKLSFFHSKKRKTHGGSFWFSKIGWQEQTLVLDAAWLLTDNMRADRGHVSSLKISPFL